MNTISDPLQSQKTAAANIGLGNYQTASGNVPSLQGVAGNLGQSQNATLANENPLFQNIYSMLSQDTSGTGGPYSALTKNLLGSFDTQQNNTQQMLQQQLQAQGLLGSGAGMATLGEQGVNAAQARAGLVDQNQVNEMSMADQLAQQLSQQNQVQGYSNPMNAIGQIQSLATPPQFQNVDNTYYTPQSKFQTTADILGAGSQLLGSAMSSAIGSASQGGGQASPSNGAPSLGSSPSAPSNYYTGGGQGVQSLLNNPQLLAMLSAGGG
jgi:hypothetical protein